MSLAFADPLLGTTIAQRYRLISRLGSGGMASVYLARHVLIERLIAIKLLNRDLSEVPAYKDRFLREARAVNRINHPNIVEIADYGESDGRVYLVMEYVPGESLMRLLERGPLGWRRAAGIGLQVAAALGRAHQMGVIHRDLKPANILLVARRDGDDVKLTDFGVAKMIDATTLTTTQVALGTPGYVAPEYQTFGSIDARSDLFSLGVVLYEITSGQLPFDASLQANCVSGSLPSPTRLSKLVPDVPTFFEEIVMTLLALDPDDRPRDGFEAFDLLRRLMEREGVAAPEAVSTRGDRRSSDPGSPRREGAQAITNEPTLANAGDAPRRAGPHLMTVSPEKIGPICRAALARIMAFPSEALSTRGVRDALEDAQRLVASVSSIAAMVTADTEAREQAQAQARAERGGLGRELDAVAREHSRTLGWAGTIAERTYAVHTARTSGEHPVTAVEAMVWEQATLEQEEDRARDHATALAAKMQALQVALDQANERLEHQMLVITAQLEGRIAALRSIALEAALVLEQAAAGLGVPANEVWAS